VKAPDLFVTTNVKLSDLHGDDLAVEIEDEYDPLLPNSYEQVLKERRAEREKQREEEVCTYNVHYIICAVYMCSAVHMYIVHV
jgi:glycerate-2-kinase